MLRDYLDGFTTASKSQENKGIVYLDAFAGRPENKQRGTGNPIDGSARIALKTTDAPFTCLRFFELPGNAQALKATLMAEFPGRDLDVVPGDCNTSIPQALRQLSGLKYAPTFAFLDPDGMDLHWTTLQALAAHKLGKYKVELWMLFFVTAFHRSLGLDPARIRQEDLDRIDRLFGTAQWQDIYVARRDHNMSASRAQREYVNLMRWRLENDLGYAHTHALEVRNTRGLLYMMIFATDNDVGNRIMAHLYRKAAETFPRMRAAELERRREERTGQASLFEAGDLPPPEVAAPVYQHEPPWEPFALVAEEQSQLEAQVEEVEWLDEEDWDEDG